MIEKFCKFCKKSFYVYPYRKKIAIYCSQSCRAKDATGIKAPHYQGKRIKYTCGICNKVFYSYFKTARYCSNKCRFVLQTRRVSFRKGKKYPPYKIGRRFKMPQGYILVYRPDHPFASKSGNIMEHRLVMEQVLDRYLKPEERIHHINGIKDDNRPENLQLFDNLSKHSNYHFPKGSYFGIHA
jgi:hypothetical protein